MFNRNAVIIADYCIDKGWIEEEMRDWCVYAMEKRQRLLFFFFSISVWAILSRNTFETVTFLFPFYCLRRRVGGYHASSPIVCYVLSIMIVVLSCGYIGKWMLCIPDFVIIIADSCVMLFSYLIKPNYPSQICFTDVEKLENHRRKNCFLIILFITQLCSIPFFQMRLIIFCSLGISISCILLLFQILKELLLVDRN